jgi:DNA replication protein DnaC
LRKKARSIKCQFTIGKLPAAKDLSDSDFNGTAINEDFVRDLATGDFLSQQRSAILAREPVVGKTHLSVSMAVTASVPAPVAVSSMSLILLTAHFSTPIDSL